MNSVIHNKTPRPNPKLERGGVQGGCKPVPRDRNFLCEDRGRLRHLSSVRFRRMAMRWARVGQALKPEISNNVIFASAVVCLKGPGESGNAPKYLSRFRANRFDTQLLPNLFVAHRVISAVRRFIHCSTRNSRWQTWATLTAEPREVRSPMGPGAHF